MKVGYLDCFSGMSSSRFIGALANAGVPEKLLHDAVAALDIDAHLELVTIRRNNIATTRAHVSLPSIERTAPYYDFPTFLQSKPLKGSIQLLSTIRAMIMGAAIPFKAKELAVNTFTYLAEAEAKIRGLPLEEVHFHEIRALNTIVGITVSCVACAWLKIDKWYASPLNVGSGLSKRPQGSIPIPTPTTLALLQDAPIFAFGPQRELLTSTCAALLRALKVDYSLPPPIRICNIGYGAGRREYDDLPNYLRFCVGFTNDHKTAPIIPKIIITETEILSDHAERFDGIRQQLLDHGAQNIIISPLLCLAEQETYRLAVTCFPAQAETIHGIMFRELNVQNLHWREENLESLIHYDELVPSPWGKIMVRVEQLLNNKIISISPDQNKCQQIAEQHNIPIDQIVATVRSILLSRKKSLTMDD